MTQPKPKVGDIWKCKILSKEDYWLVVEKYLNREKNTHFVTLQNISEQDYALMELEAVYIRAKWEFIG
jgi:hypothetical protein